MLTAEHIQHQQFHVRFRGFDVDEVDTFLEKVAEHYTLLVTENKKMRAELETMQGQQAETQSQEDTFKNAIISAQTIASEMQKKATDEAEQTLSSAQEKAATILATANKDVIALEEKITSLEQEKERIKDELRTFLSEQIDSLDNNTTPPSLNEPEPPTPQAIAESDSREEVEAADEEEQVIPEFEARDDDLSDLYEKIELPDDLANDLNMEDINRSLGQTPLPAESAEDTDLTDIASQVLAEEELPNPATPELDDDMLFTLEDPLDEQDPDVEIDFSGNIKK